MSATPISFRSALFALLLPVVAHAAPQKDKPPFTGLPVGSGLDARKVMEARYGNADLPGPVVPVVGAVATIAVESKGGAPGEPVPITFGQVFAQGALARDATLTGLTANGLRVRLQIDVKAVHPDGSVRHAVISAVLPRPERGKRQVLALVEGPSPSSSGLDAATPNAPVPDGPGPSASVIVDIAGKRYMASLDRLPGDVRPRSWLVGPVVNEWLIDKPLRSADGAQHRHLQARFAVRTYGGAGRARIDVTVENAWAYEPAPQNFTYDVEISVNGKPVYSKASLTQFHHTRWRKVFWSGGDPDIEVRHSTRDLISSKAIPNYDPQVAISDSALAALAARRTGARTEPMGTGEALPVMPTTGGRSDIGLLPGWAVMYLLSMDLRAKMVTLGTADLAGSYPMHYRDQRTGRPVSLVDYPFMTIYGLRGDTLNPATGKLEAFPACAADGACASANTHDVPHQPSLAYLPYLVTGDYYYLEELQFWAMYNVFSSNPAYRENRKGLLKPDQVRGQAWGLRTLAHAAWITPDSDPLKKHFTQLLDNNLTWYNAAYPENPMANRLHVLNNGPTMAYLNGTGLAPWQDDFFTAAVGHVAELGYAKAYKLLTWKAQFAVQRMINRDVCWIDAAVYEMKVRDTPDSPLYGSIGQAYRATQKPEIAALPCGGPEMAAAYKLGPGEMTGHSSATEGFPSNMQPALAYGVGAAGADGRKAWERFMARSVKPDYGLGPQFAIVPR
jgi:hypothetical protein